MKKIGLIILIIICSTSYIYGFPLENNDSILLEKDTLQLGIAPLSDNSLINTEGYIPSVIRPSPQSQLFDKYINHKVTEYNGLPEISIPLYEIEMKGLKIPISLTYHASGIQFRQSDGDVGTGWSINAGGYRVSRTIYGLPDEDAELYDTYEYLEELRNSYSNPFTLHFDDYLSSIDRNFINPFSNLDVFKAPAKDQDGAYDIFTYSLPSGGGHFLITDRETKEIIILEGNVERINFNKSNFKEIQIVDGNGFTYHLGGQYSGFEYNEYCKRIPQIIEKPTASSWLLRQIKSPYSEFLEFNYSHYHIQRDPEHDDPTSHVFFSSLVAQDAGISYDLWHCPSFLDSPAQPYFPNQLWLTDRNIHESFLNEIKNDEVTVRFVRSYNTNNDRLVKEIQVLNHQKQIIKRIEFQYNYVEPHSLLSSITIKGDSDIEMQKYDFDYYNPPYLNSYADQWGYYLFTERNTGPKGFSITLHEEFKKEHLLQSCFNGNLLSLNSPHILYTNERKNYGDFWFPKNSNDAPHYYSLKSIKFPTGGQTIYEYEPNKFQERNINNTDVYTGNGQRIKRIISKTSMNDNDIPIVTNFKYGKGESGIGICDIALKSEHFSTQSLVLYTASEPASIGEPLSFFALKSSRTYNERAVAPDVLFPKVNYEQVTSYSYNDLSTTAQPNGKIISIYSIPYVYTFNTLNSMTGYEDPWHGIASPYNELSKIFNHKFYRDRQHGIPSRILGRSPYLQSKEIYSVDNKLMKKTDYKYKQLYTSSVYFNLNTVQTLHHEGQDARTVCAFNYSFAHGEYTIIGARDLLMQAKTIDYFDKNDSIVSSELYEYDDKHLSLIHI